MYDLLAAVGAKVVINWLVFVPATMISLCWCTTVSRTKVCDLLQPNNIGAVFALLALGVGEMQPARGSWYHVTVHQVL